MSTNRASAEERRSFILDTLKKEESCSFDRVVEQFGETSDQTLYNDVRVFRDRGERITVENREFLIDESGSDTLAVRRKSKPRRKEQVAKTALALLLGEEEKLVIQNDESLSKHLAQLSCKAHRTLIVDGGSTTEAISNQIASLKVPARNLSSLKVVTNGLNIYQVFEDQQSEKKPEVVLVGGTVRWETHSVSGDLANRTLATLQLHADISFVGATSFRSNLFSCNHESEASMKSSLLQSANIRCVVVDSSKLTTAGGTAANWIFASLDSIDAVVSDHGVLESEGFLAVASDHRTAVVTLKTNA